MSKRIGIFAFYDKDAIIDDYVVVYLSAMKNVLDEILFISNGAIPDNEKLKVDEIVDEFIIRENKGFDAAAYKKVILENKEYIKDACEIVLFNDTVFGPIYPMEDIFSEMRSRDLDFWGITRHAPAIAWDTPVPACVQSYFIVIEKRLLVSEEFYEFWEGQSSNASRLEEVVVNFEFAFTEYFERRGYIWDTYVDFTELDSSEEKYNFSPTYYANYELIKNKRYPFIKRKNFSFHDGYRLCNGEDIFKCYEYVRNRRLYDTKLIWKNILRIYDVLDIYGAMHLSYITNYTNNTRANGRALLCAFINNELTINYFVEKLSEVECCFKKIILIKTDVVRKNIDIFLSSKVSFIAMDELIDTFIADDSELICFVSDILHDESDRIYSKSATYSNVDNAISSKNEVEYIKGLFKDNESLGILMTPDSYIGTHCNTAGGVWNETQFERVKLLQKSVKSSYPINIKISQISNSNTFWCRREAIQRNISEIENKEDIDFLDLIRLFPYIAAENYFFSGMILSNEQARIEYVNHCMIFGNFVGAFRNEDIILDFPLGYMRGITQISDFCEGCKSIYIYGAGDFAQRIYNVLKNMPINIRAFVVKNKSINPSIYCGLPVIEISEMDIEDDIGVIIGLSSEKQLSVKRDLRELGIKKIYRI